MKLSRAVQEFIAEARHRLSPQTITAYESDLARLVAVALGSTGDSVLHFTPQLARRYFELMSQQGCSMATIYRRHSALREFGRWGKRRRLWTENPLELVDRPRKPPRGIPRPFDPDETARLMALELPPVERAFRGLLYYTGLRVTPICDLRIGDLSFSAVTYPDGLSCPGTIRSVGKGRVPLVTPMFPALRELLFDYVMTSTDMKPATSLLTQASGRSYNRRLAEKMTHRWGVRAGVVKCLPHRFRHTFATDLLRQGGDIRVIQQLMAHADLGTTQIYTRVTDPQLVAAVLRLPSWDSRP